MILYFQQLYVLLFFSNYSWSSVVFSNAIIISSISKNCRIVELRTSCDEEIRVDNSLDQLNSVVRKAANM
jgi:hypothetical protein